MGKQIEFPINIIVMIRNRDRVRFSVRCKVLVIISQNYATIDEYRNKG